MPMEKQHKSKRQNLSDQQSQQTLDYSEVQRPYNKKILKKYFQIWIDNVEEYKKQTLQKMKMFRLLSNREQEEYQQQQQAIHNGQNIIQNIGSNANIVTGKYQKKMKIKTLQSFMRYNILTNQFMNKIASAYCQYLYKKYFEIISEFRQKKEQERVYKVQKMIKKLRIKMWKERTAKTIAEKKKYADTQQSKKNREINLSQFNQTHQNDRKKKQFQQTSQIQILTRRGHSTQTSGFYNHNQRVNQTLGLSRNSNVSQNSLSNQSQFLTRRKFRPILEAPSFPDLKQVQEENSMTHSPIHNKNFVQKNQSRLSLEQTPRQLLLNLNSQTNSKIIQNKQESSCNQNLKQSTIKKQMILGLLTKLKLTELNILSQKQFREGSQSSHQYEIYRQMSRNTLKKLKNLRIQS